MRTALIFLSILIVYGLLLVFDASSMPLRLGEILQAAAFLKFSWESFFLWVAASPVGPLHYLAQLPFALSWPNSPFYLRLPSIVCALGSAFSFYVLTRRVPLHYPLLALLLFIAVPTHLAYATQGRPYELALFLMLLSALVFFSILEQPTFFKMLLYLILLTACLYTQSSSLLPAVGHLLFLLGFVNLKRFRNALWVVLISTALAVAAYAPYYLWTEAHRGDWLEEGFPAYALKIVGLQPFMSLDPEVGTPWFGVGLMILLLIGLAGGIWSALPLGAHRSGSPPPSAGLLEKRTVVFCLAGGSLVTIIGETAVNAFAQAPFPPYQILCAVPGLVVVFCAALDAITRVNILKSFWIVSPALTLLAVALCVPGAVEYLQTKPTDLGKLAGMVRLPLAGDACIVFVSQGVSRSLFEVFDADLPKHECQTFFNKRVILAIHPYVRPDQERNALLYFTGLDFEEKHRDVVGDGKVITMDSRH